MGARNSTRIVHPRLTRHRRSLESDFADVCSRRVQQSGTAKNEESVDRAELALDRF
jgi:hypothetical protein